MCEHYLHELEEHERHYVNAEDYNNCVLCLVKEKGAMTQDEVSQYLNLSKMRISQIQNQAIKKLCKKIKSTAY